MCRRASSFETKGRHCCCPSHRSTRETFLFVDRSRRYVAEKFVLRSGGTGATDCADDLAAIDKRYAATRCNDVIQRQDVIEPEFLHCILERTRRAAVRRSDWSRRNRLFRRALPRRTRAAGPRFSRSSILAATWLHFPGWTARNSRPSPSAALVPAGNTPSTMARENWNRRPANGHATLMSELKNERPRS
jgi:hypothetical protein